MKWRAYLRFRVALGRGRHRGPGSRAQSGKSALACVVVVLAMMVSLVIRPTLQAQEQHPGEYSPADIENGARTYAGQCLTCHAITGDGVGGVDLRRGVFRRVSSDDDLRRVISTGVAGTGMPKFEFSPTELNGIVAFIRAGFDVGGRAAKVGDRARGRAVFEKKGNCGSCHRVSGSGARKGPDLTDIGSLRTASMLQQTLVDPTTYLLPINRPVRVVAKDGTVVTGRRLNEDTYTIQVLDETGRLRSFVKADLKEFRVTTAATMPSFRETLTADEIADVVAYLLSLKG